MTTTGTQDVASDSGARPYATVNPYTGKTVREFPFLDSGQIPTSWGGPQRPSSLGASARSPTVPGWYGAPVISLWSAFPPVTA